MSDKTTETTKTTVDNVSEILAGKQAPAQVGKPIYSKALDKCKWAGAEKSEQIFGKAIDDLDDKTPSTPLNFGSKASTGFLSEEERLMLFFFKKSISNLQIQAQYKSRSAYPSKAVYESVPAFKLFKEMCKAFDIASWQQWIDTVQARFFFEEYELPMLLADQFDQMPMSSPLVRAPGALGLLYGELEDDTANFTPQYNSQASYLVESKNNVVHTVITQDLLDDSSPAIIDKIRREVVKGIARSYERSLIDGDTTLAHQDSDVLSARDFRKAFKGLRKLALANSANGSVYDHLNDSPNKALWASLLQYMGKQASMKDDLIYIIGTTISHDLVTGAIPELFTAFAFGGLASNVTGQVPPVFGVKNLESSYIREDLNALGVHDGVTTNRTTALLVQRSRFLNWTRQATRVWATPSLANTDKMLMSAKARHTFAGLPQTAEEKSVVVAVNIKTV